MKVLSLTQPWATLVVIGAKRIETRGWPCRVTGRVAIHASKGFPRDCKDMCLDSPFSDVLQAHFGTSVVVPNLPLGCVIGEVDITGCVPTELIKKNRSYFNATENELRFGNYADFDGHSGKRRYGFMLANPLLYPTPIPAKGSLGFWEWEKP